MDIAITRMSSKGQIVIPMELRKGIRKGEKLLILRNKKQLIIQRASGAKENFDEDLAFARRTDEILEQYERHPEKFITRSGGDFLKELEKW